MCLAIFKRVLKTIIVIHITRKGGSCAKKGAFVRITIAKRYEKDLCKILAT